MKNVVASLVIPNWNGKKFLKICLPSLQKQTFKDFEIVVVDNGSSDGSKEFIAKYYPEVKVVALAKNIGFAPAVNLGIKNSTGKYIILVNNDTKVAKDCIKFLVKAADRKKEVGMVAAKMLNFYDPRLIDSAGDYIDVVGHADNIGRGEKDGDRFERAGYIFLVTGGGSLYKRAVFEAVGLFDDDYFAYFEDVDLGLRAQMYGFKAWFEPKAVIYHIHKATSNRNKQLTEYLQFRNMTINILKNFPSGLLVKDFNWLRILLVNINTVRYLASQGYLMAALKADGYVLVNLLKILKKRSRSQALKRVSSEALINNFKPKKITLFGLFPKGI